MALDRMPEIGDLVKDGPGCMYRVIAVCDYDHSVSIYSRCDCRVKAVRCTDAYEHGHNGYAAHFVAKTTTWQWAEDPFDRMVKQVREEAGL